VAQPKTKAAELYEQLSGGPEITDFQLRRIDQEAEKLLRASPDVAADAYAIRGVVAGRFGDHDAAFEHLKRAIRLVPDNRYYRYQAGVALMLQERLDEALEWLSAVQPDKLRGAPVAEHHALMAELHFKRGELEQAHDRFREAIATLRPDVADCLLSVGVHGAQIGYYEEAVELTARAYEKFLGVPLGSKDATDYLLECGAPIGTPVMSAINALRARGQVNPSLPWHPASSRSASEEDQADDLAVHAAFATARRRANAAAFEE
jgi:tetratricopeptide (TPR) repeat protein